MAQEKHPKVKSGAEIKQETKNAFGVTNQLVMTTSTVTIAVCAVLGIIIGFLQYYNCN